MKPLIFLSFKKFNILNYRTYLAPFIRLACYFNGRGMHGLLIKLHHCGVVFGDVVIEALAEGVVITTIADIEKRYDEIVYLELNFEYDEWEFRDWCYRQIGKKYDFSGVMFYKLFFQMFGWKLRKKPSKKVDCTFFAKGLCLMATTKEVRKEFRNYSYFDPQDFGRLWKSRGLFKQVEHN